MTKIKICGLTRMEDIKVVNSCMPDYIGFVFAKSKRQVEKEMARRLKDKLDPAIQSVGVFVNEEISNIIPLWEEKTIDMIQLHGEENEDYIKELRNALNIGESSFIEQKTLCKSIIKAIRVRDLSSIEDGKNVSADYLLFDTYNQNQYGGSGQTFGWDLFASAQNSIKKPFFLAGGIHSQNIEEAVCKMHPYCIDVSSGAETDGLKDSDKIRGLVEKIRSV